MIALVHTDPPVLASNPVVGYGTGPIQDEPMVGPGGMASSSGLEQ